MFDDVDGLDSELKYIASLLDQVRGKLSDRFLRIELADHLALPQFTLTDEPPEGRVWRFPG